MLLMNIINNNGVKHGKENKNTRPNIQKGYYL